MNKWYNSENPVTIIYPQLFWIYTLYPEFIPESCQHMEYVFSLQSRHPIKGCNLGGVFIVLEQKMQEFGRLGMLSNYFL